MDEDKIIEGMFSDNFLILTSELEKEEYSDEGDE